MDRREAADSLQSMLTPNHLAAPGRAGVHEAVEARRSSTRQLARTAGGLYVISIVLGLFAIGIVPSMLFAAGDIEATVTNLQGNEPLYRLSLAAHLVVTLVNVPLATIFFAMFRAVDERMTLRMLLFLGAGTAVEAASLVAQFVPLIAVGQSAPGALTGAEVITLGYLPFEVALAGYDVSAAFFGCYGILLGVLAWRSGLVPRPIGALVALGALAYITYSFGHIVAPASASQFVPWIQLPSLVGESSFALWLLSRGVVDDPRRSRAG